MGLDAVELILETEATFDVEIHDETAGGLYTLGDLYLLVLSARGDAIDAKYDPEHTTPLQKVRKDLAATLNLNIESIDAEDKLEEILPRKGRGVFWKLLAQGDPSDGAGLKYPKLRYPKWIVRIWSLFFLFWPMLALASFVFLSIGEDRIPRGVDPMIPQGWAVQGLIAGLVMLFVLIVFQTILEGVGPPKIANRLPVKTVRELSEVVLATNASYFLPCLRDVKDTDMTEDQSAKRKTIDDAMFDAAWKRLRPALAETYGVPEEEIEPSTQLKNFPRPTIWNNTWEDLSNKCGLTLPPQSVPFWMFLVYMPIYFLSLVALAAIPGGIVIAIFLKRFVWLSITLAGLAYFPIFNYSCRAISKLTASSQMRFPKDVETVGALTRRAMLMNAPMLFSEIEEELNVEIPTGDSIETDPAWIVLRHLIANQTDADETMLKPSMKFTEIGF